MKKLELEKRINSLTEQNLNNSSKSVLLKALENTETQIFHEISLKNALNVEKHFELIDSLDGAFNPRGMWKVKSKLFPRTKDPPTVKVDANGNKITSLTSLKNLYMKTYISRLEHRKMRPQFLELEKLKEELWELRLIQLKSRSCEPWTLSDLRRATMELKSNKCRDPDSLISEIFKEGVAGNDLNAAVLGLMNGVLETFHIPEKLLKSNITSI